MKLNQLRDLVAIAERGSLRAAARHLQLAQPALTRSIRELEREIGTPLFERRAHGMLLTPMGEALVRRLSNAFEERRKRLVNAIGAFLPEWHSTEGAGGTSLWLEGPRGTDARNLAALAASRSVLIEPGDRFFDRTEQPSRFLRLGISSIALQHIEPGIRELATAAGRRPAAA